MDSSGPDRGPDVLDARIDRLVALLADRDQQLRDRLVLDELAARADRALGELADALARAGAAEQEAVDQRHRAERAEAELAALRHQRAHPPRRPVTATLARAARRAVVTPRRVDRPT